WVHVRGGVFVCDGAFDGVLRGAGERRRGQDGGVAEGVFEGVPADPRGGYFGGGGEQGSRVAEDGSGAAGPGGTGGAGGGERGGRGGGGGGGEGEEGGEGGGAERARGEGFGD